MTEIEKALEIAERWKHRTPDHMQDTVSGAIFEEMGILSRALLEASEELKTLRATVEDWSKDR